MITFNFLKYRWISAIASVVLIAAFLGGIVYKRQTRGSAFVYSVDFTGGTQVLMQFSEPVGSNKIDIILDDLGLQGATTRELSGNETLIRVKDFDDDPQGLADRIKQGVEEQSDGVTATIMQTDSVGSGIGEEFRWSSIKAVGVGLLLMLLYIWVRFWSISYAVGSVVSLAHDVLIILTVVLWFDYEISLNIIGALLFILGYSINDTIVIFSRIRETLSKSRDSSISEIINQSINHTLRRTILTSLATCLVVVALLMFGGEALRPLSLALLIGMVFGTYSSIFIASPVMQLLYKKD
jgi:preprotein translocase subunit SecF